MKFCFRYKQINNNLTTSLNYHLDVLLAIEFKSPDITVFCFNNTNPNWSRNSVLNAYYAISNLKFGCVRCKRREQEHLWTKIIDKLLWTEIP